MVNTYDAQVLSDVGCVRDHNEDDSLLLPAHGVYVVADGMGGHACGEVASAISVRSVEEFYCDPDITERLRQVYDELCSGGRAGDLVSFHEFRLRSAIEYGNLQIFRQASTDPALEDMGTTIVGIAFVGHRAYVAHVGDSRAYRVRDGRLTQLTEDHSLANEFIRMNILRPEDLPRFPYKNVIVRALGLQEQVVVDTVYWTALAGDRFILCSDGLTDLVPDDEILALSDRHEDAESCCEALVRQALDYGGIDNVTVLVVDALEGAEDGEDVPHTAAAFASAVLDAEGIALGAAAIPPALDDEPPALDDEPPALDDEGSLTPDD